MMDFDEYQEQARKLAIYDEQWEYMYTILGLVGEAGEVADKYKKVLRDNNGELTAEIKMELIKELGDVLWYVANLAYELGYSLDQVARLNILKLTSRKERDVLKGSGDNR